MKRLLILISIVAMSCGKDEAPAPAAVPMQVQQASTALVSQQPIITGPRLTGTLEPQQSATIIAETGGTVIAAPASEGQAVSRGAVIARIADESAMDGLRSAQVAVQSSETATAMARRDLERATRLEAAGALAARDVEVARSQLATAQAQLAQARSLSASASQRVGDQTVVASVSGIIGDKSVSQGDVVTPGAPLYTIIDLSTLQLEASVPADALSQIQTGNPVDLQVRGYPEETFRGTLTRISPQVDPGTGQVQVYVAVDNQGRRLVAGLFAEGRVRTVARAGLVIPIDAVDDSGANPTVLRVVNGVTERVVVRLGVRDDSAGWVEVVSGLNAGDRVLTGPSRTISPGARVDVN